MSADAPLRSDPPTLLELLAEVENLRAALQRVAQNETATNGDEVYEGCTRGWQTGLTKMTCAEAKQAGTDWECAPCLVKRVLSGVPQEPT